MSQSGFIPAKHQGGITLTLLATRRRRFAAERSAVSTAPAAVMEAEKRKAGVLQTPEEEKPLFMAEIDRQMIQTVHDCLLNIIRLGIHRPACM